MDSLSPQIEDYSLNNIPLPDNLVPEWSRYLEDLSAVITVVDEKVAALESVLAIAKQRQALLKRRKTQVTSFRSAIRRFPAEIISLILIHALEVDERPLDHTGRGQFLGFRSVCSLWRAAAFNTLSLWQSLDVDASHWDSSGPVAFTSTMASWFSRAGPDAKLHLAVGSTSSSLTPSVSIHHVTSLIDTISLPISTLKIKTGILKNEEDLTELVAAALARPTVSFLGLPLLSVEELHYNFNDLTGLPHTYPSLQRLALTGTNSRTLCKHESLTWLALDVPVIYPSLYLDGLPALEELFLSVETIYWDAIGAPYVLSNLKRLTIKNQHNHCVLVPLASPSLEYIHLVDIFTDVSSEVLERFCFTLEDLLRRSQAGKVTLRITNDANATILRKAVFEKPNLNIHQLELADINLLLHSEEFNTTRQLPQTLEEIIAWQTPLIEVNRFQRRPELSPPSPATRNDAQAAEQQTSNQRTVTVYIPDGPREAELLNAEEQESSGAGGNLRLQLLSVTQNMVWRMLWETGGSIPRKDVTRQRT